MGRELTSEADIVQCVDGVKTCFMQGLKQHIRVVQSFWGLRVRNYEGVSYPQGFLACLTASQVRGDQETLRFFFNLKKMLGWGGDYPSRRCLIWWIHLAEVSVGEGDDIVHAGEFFPVLVVRWL